MLDNFKFYSSGNTVIYPVGENKLICMQCIHHFNPPEVEISFYEDWKFIKEKDGMYEYYSENGCWQLLVPYEDILFDYNKIELFGCLFKYEVEYV